MKGVVRLQGVEQEESAHRAGASRQLALGPAEPQEQARLGSRSGNSCTYHSTHPGCFSRHEMRKSTGEVACRSSSKGLST